MWEPAPTPVSIWKTRTLAATKNARFISGHPCIHEAPQPGEDEFLHTQGKPVYQCWTQDDKTPLTRVYSTQGAAQAQASLINVRAICASGVFLEIKGPMATVVPIKVPDAKWYYSQLPRTDQPCKRCPRRCLWPNCDQVCPTGYDLRWHQAIAHGICHDITSFWDLMPCELWLLVADWLKPTTIHEVWRLLPVLWTSRDHPLPMILREHVSTFLNHLETQLFVPASPRGLYNPLPVAAFPSKLLLLAETPRLLFQFLTHIHLLLLLQ